MIVSNFNNGSPSALQGVDFLARSARPASDNPEASSFSDLLGSSEQIGGAEIDAQKARTQSRGKASVTTGGGTSEPTEQGGGRQPESLQSQDAPSLERTTLSLGLDDAPPILRDARLDDPEELALEAVAIALAASLLQKPQEPAPSLVIEEELTFDSQPKQGGGLADHGVLPEDPQPALVAPVVSLGGEITKPNVALVSPANVSQLEPDERTVRAVPVEKRSVEVLDGQRPWASVLNPKLSTDDVLPSASGAAPTPAPNNVVPKISSEILLNATQQQAAVLAENAADFAVVRGAVAAQVSVSQGSSEATASPLPLVRDSGSQSNEQSVLNDSQYPQGQVPADSASVSQPVSDLELLSSPLPANPAAAFFAGQVQQAEPPKSVSAGEIKFETAESGDGSSSSGASSDSGMSSNAAATSDLVERGSEPRSDLKQFAKSAPQVSRESGSSVSKEFVPSVGKSLPDGLDVASQEQSEIGTLDAGTDGVHRESSPELALTEEMTTPIVSEGVGSASSEFSPADFSMNPSSRVVEAGIPAHSGNSRPTVLPPVHARSSELFNVVQNALERARSENPSHLAVEVTLDDGSSFGLEVRMSASGLQASFRSESQPLLRALENSWSGFLAKETAESKVVSAAFEGRSGFGEFSNNGSSAGERRQQFEDSATAALLGSRVGKAPASEIPSREVVSKIPVTVGGMAVYA